MSKKKKTRSLITKARQLARNLYSASREIEECLTLLECLDNTGGIRYNQYEKVVQTLEDLIDAWGAK